MENTIFPDLIVCQGKYCQSKTEHNTIETENKTINFILVVYSLPTLTAKNKHNICAVYIIYLVDMYETKHAILYIITGTHSHQEHWHFIVSLFGSF